MLLEKIAAAHVAQTEAGYAAYLKQVLDWDEKKIQEWMAKRERDGNCKALYKVCTLPGRGRAGEPGACSSVRVDLPHGVLY